MAFNYTRKNANEYDSVMAAKANLDANSTYNKSDSVLAAEKLRDEHAANKVKDWTGGSYGQAVQDALAKINNREKFSYDLNGDALYNQYKDQYINAGRLAMVDTIGQASAMTGGYGNSYATIAGNQAYQGYLQNLNDVVPQLYEMALNQYNQEGQDLKDNLAINQSLYNTEYGEYRDKVSDWNAEQSRLDANAYNEANMDYTKFSDNRNYLASLYNTALDWATNDANTDYNNMFANYQQQVSEDQFAKQYALQQQQLAAQRASSSQSSKISELQNQLAVYKQMDDFTKGLIDENTFYNKATAVTRGNRGNTGNGGYKYKGTTYSNYKAYVKAQIGDAYNNGKLTADQANQLLDKYGI